MITLARHFLMVSKKAVLCLRSIMQLHISSSHGVFNLEAWYIVAMHLFFSTVLPSWLLQGAKMLITLQVALCHLVDSFLWRCKDLLKVLTCYGSRFALVFNWGHFGLQDFLQVLTWKHFSIARLFASPDLETVCAVKTSCQSWVGCLHLHECAA